TILSPCKKLKKIQYQLKKELEIIYKPRSCANGFIKERNNIKNANSHLSKRYIFNLDLQDFFPSITKKRVFFLLKSNGLNFNTEVAEILAKLICHEGVLPQGSPCSPIISNMIAYRMDRELIQLAKMHNATYTRYVDDITFSFTTRFKALPKSILTFKEDELTVGEKLTEIIDSNGFTINQSKVRLGKRSNRMEVTGLTVNEKLNVRRKYIKKIRVLFHLIEKHGEEEANRIFATFKRTRGSKYPPQIKQTLYGMLIYLGQVIKTNASLFYKFAMRYNKLNYSKKLPIIKPKEQLAREALWIVDSIDDDAECYQGTAFSISSGLIVT
ncbi:reverse transcriptase family protein, partial [Acinetobacter baumannii]|nr:reverse transcriptase family protein [Acinetobacter baumannii]